MPVSRQVSSDAPHLPRPLTFVPIVSGPSRGCTARVPEEPDGAPVAEVPIDGVTYVAQRGRDGWEYVVPGQEREPWQP